MEDKDKRFFDKLVSCKDLDTFNEEVVQLFRKGIVLQKLLGYTEEEMDAQYLLGRQLFEEQNFESSINVLSHLVMLNPLVPEYWMTLGTAQQRDERFDAALESYNLASILDPENSQSYMRAALCHVLMDETEEAILSFRLALEAAKLATNAWKTAVEARMWIRKLEGEQS